MATFMSSFMSLAISFLNIGLIEGFVFIWLKAWLFSFFVALPTVMIVSPLVKKLVTRIVED
jgi:hypothetical protein